ncbi:MAG: hypothetical protein QNI99_09310 [Woeseiaceae bacterium]|nr:hypothetical protein [Woeseiaceae bacterium]
MLTILITSLLYTVGLGLTFLLIWGVPTYFIYREQHVPEQEKLLWIIANAFFPWIAFLVFMLVAPVTSRTLN